MAGLDGLVRTVRSNRDQYKLVADGKLQLAPMGPPDREIMQWSRTVGQLALGAAHPAMQQATATTIF